MFSIKSNSFARFIFLISLFFSFLSIEMAFGQEIPIVLDRDTLDMVEGSDRFLFFKKKPKFMRKAKNSDANFSEKKALGSASRAALMSALFPGLGQFYNKKYWKIPLVWGGLGFLGYYVGLQNEDYLLARDNLFFLTDGDDETQVDPRFFFFTEDNLRRRRDKSRRDRDYYIILSSLFYGLVISDAAVDGHLNKFDVSDDLSATVRPKVMRMDQNFLAINQTPQLIPGFSVILTLK